MGCKVTRVRTDVKGNKVTVTAFGPSTKGRKRLLGQKRKIDGKPSEMIADLIKELENSD